MQAKHKNTGRWEGVKPRLSHFQVHLAAKKCGPEYCFCADPHFVDFFWLYFCAVRCWYAGVLATVDTR
jgi:hypothetical protein